MTREEVTVYVNRIVREEHGMPMKVDEDKLIDTGVDSFGIVMVLLALEDKYGVYDKEELSKIVVEELTLGAIVNRVLNESK